MDHLKSFKVQPDIDDVEKLLKFDLESYPSELYQAYNLKNTKNSTSKKNFLVCHDFKGGYRQDCHLFAKPNNPLEFFIPKEILPFITEFVYFSHHFITVPPTNWINLCHRFGVKCYGVIITEWEEGKIKFKEMLTPEENRRNVVEKLKEIRRHFNFDGWLINIENNVDHPEYLEDLKKFMDELREDGEEDKDKSKIIWYDSILSNGSLDWQNKLCPANLEFYNRSDGIFLNYWFSKSGLQESLKISQPTPEKVYASIDCFAPRTIINKIKRWPLGGWHCKTVLEKIQEVSTDFSLAVFAPGWLFESEINNLNQELENSKMPKIDPQTCYNLTLKWWSQFSAFFSDRQSNYQSKIDSVIENSTKNAENFKSEFYCSLDQIRDKFYEVEKSDLILEKDEEKKLIKIHDKNFDRPLLLISLDTNEKVLTDCQYFPCLEGIDIQKIELVTDNQNTTLFEN